MLTLIVLGNSGWPVNHLEIVYCYELLTLVYISGDGLSIHCFLFSRLHHFRHMYVCIYV